MKNWTKKNIFLSSLLTVLGIICFPVNLLVIIGVIKPGFNQFAYWIGWVVWLFGMLLVLSPMIMFPRKGGVAKGKAFVHTTKIVNTGIYSVVRHPQYLGGVFAIFITTILWYPHWLFVVLGIFGAVVIFLSSKEEDQRLMQKFGEEYKEYKQKVPGMNILLGVVRYMKRRKERINYE